MTIIPSRRHATRRAVSLTAIAITLGLAATACGGSESVDAPDSVGAVTPAAGEAPTELVDINTATEAELVAIPGVGEEIADEIMEYRPYDSFDKFREEMSKYISDDEIARIETYLTLG